MRPISRKNIILRRKFMKLRFWAGAVVLAAAPALTFAQELVIGGVLSLTGPYAFVGKSAIRGMELAIEEINTANQAGPGRKLKLAVEDDGSNNNQAITLLTKFATNPATIAIAGPTASATVVAAAPAANEHKIPMFGIAVSTAVNAAGPWSNRILNSPAALFEALSDYSNKRFKPKTVMTVASRDNDGAAAQSTVARKWFEGKVTLLPEESALMADTDFSALATKIASQKPSLVIITLNDAAAANLILQARQAGVGKEVQFISNNATAQPSFIKIGGKAVEGTVMATDALPEIRTDAMTKKYVADFQKKYGAIPDQFATIGYTIIKLYGQSIASIKGQVTRDGVRSALTSIKNVPVVIGDGKTNFSFDKDRNPVYKPIIVEVKDQRHQAVP
jgi:branched-chain amino acid transport system substrate-binding protein